MFVDQIYLKITFKLGFRISGMNNGLRVKKWVLCVRKKR